MSYERSLRDVLKEKNPSLFDRLSPIENSAKRLLTYTASKFPYYTPHDFYHSKNVEENLNWIVLDEVKSKMEAHEIFFLIIAAWLHDWGMVASEEEDPELVRENHHIRTEENFDKNYHLFNLDQNEAKIVGRICKGHRKEDLHSNEYVKRYFGSNIPIRISFLASLLRMADECDITASRTPEIIYYSKC